MLKPKKLIGLAALLPMALGVSACDDQAGEPRVVQLQPFSLSNMHLRSLEVMRAALGETFSEGHLQLIEFVGHQMSVAVVCENFDIDQARVDEEMALLYSSVSGDERELTDDERHQIDKQALMGLGMVVGAQLAISSHDREEFCAVAEEERTTEDPVALDHLIWTKREVEAEVEAEAGAD